MRNNWELIDELVVTEDSRGNVMDAFECLTAIDPNTDEMHEWHPSLPDLQDHQEAINDLQEGRFPPECLCYMCRFGRGIPTESMQRFLNSHQVAIETLRLSMPGK